MGYADVFYQTNNICGWTGDVHLFPTVYFYRPMYGSFVEFGHITQLHDDEENMGREKTRIAMDYRMKNEVYEGQYRLVERWNGNEAHHPSRNIFRPLRSLDRSQWRLLAAAIGNNRELKPKYVAPTDAEIDALLG